MSVDRDAGRLVRLTSPDGRTNATIDLLGGGLHSLTLDDEPLVHTYDTAGSAPFCSGALLFPWPNRVRGGRWLHDGIELQLEVDDPELGNANHGLVREDTFRSTSTSADRVTVSTVVEPRPGYPFEVRLDTTYAAEATGLRVDHTILNLSAGPAPVALGAHPYVRVGTAPTESLLLTVAAARHLPVDATLIPVRDEPVAGIVDLREGRELGEREINTCYHALSPQGDAYRHRLAAADGRAVELWTDTSFAYAQIYVMDTFPDPDHGRARAVAVEPMTAAPDALNSGRGLRWLAPGETWELSWGLQAQGW